MAPGAEPFCPLPVPTLAPSGSAEDGLLRCKQLTLLLDWAEQFEAESRQSDEAVAFSVLLGDLNFDNCSLGERRLQRGGAGRRGPAHRAPAFLQTTRRSRSTSYSTASRTPADWARARSSPGPWVRCPTPGRRIWEGLVGRSSH